MFDTPTQQSFKSHCELPNVSWKIPSYKIPGQSSKQASLHPLLSLHSRATYSGSCSQSKMRDENKYPQKQRNEVRSNMVFDKRVQENTGMIQRVMEGFVSAFVAFKKFISIQA